MRYLVYLLGVGLSIALLFSCKKDGTKIDNLETILLGKDTLTMYSGDVARLDYKLQPAGYDSTNLIWRSSDTSVLNITNGTIRAKKEGVATVTVNNNVNTVKVSCMVTVVDTLRKGLIAYYPFNGNVQDLSGNGNHGIANDVSLVNNRFGIPGSACYFNGFSSYVVIQDKPKLSLNNTDFTLNAWVKVQSFNSSFGSEILDKRYPGANNGYSFSIWGYQNTAAPMGTYGFNGSTSTATLPLNEWHMVTLTYNVSAHKVTFYKDGLLDHTWPAYIESPSVTDAVLYIGRDNPNNDNNGYFFHGAMDDIRIYNRALNASAVSKLYANKN